MRWEISAGAHRDEIPIKRSLCYERTLNSLCSFARIIPGAKN